MKKFSVIFLGVLMVRALSAEALDLSKYKNKVVYVDFWASWCAPCKESFPWMNSLKKKYEGKGLHVVAVNLDKEKKLADAFLKENKADFEIVFDQEAVNAKSFKLKGMPSSIIVDRSGKIIHTHVGFRESEVKDVEDQIRKLLGEGKNAN